MAAVAPPPALWAKLEADPARAFPPEAWPTVRPSPAAARIKERLLRAEREIDIERARLATAGYRATAGEPMPLRRAKMLLHLAQHTSIAIDPDERIVGNRSLLPRMGVIAPEGAVNWVDRELDVLPTRPQDRFNISEAVKAELRREIFPFWRGQTLEDIVAARLPAPVRAAVVGCAFSVNQTDHAQGHILPDVESWLRLGIDGLRAKAEAARAQAVEACYGKPSAQQAAFYDSVAIALDAAAEYSRRLAFAALVAADQAPTPARRAELERISAACAWLAHHPPRGFAEALQSVWLLFVLLQMESNASSFSPGRFDQYMLPYLQADLEAGRLTLDEAQEWLEQLWLKFNQIVLLRSSSSARYFAGFPIGFNLMIGGQTAGGDDATNVLSYMCLRAQAAVGLTQPNLSLRIHAGSPHAFLAAAAHVIRKGSGMPQLFNDEVIIPGQTARGVAPADALDYAAVGCVELSIPGKALGWSDSAMFNMARVLELTLFGGRDPQTGAQIGLPTPPLDELPSFTALEAAYDRQLAYFVELMVQGCDVVDRIHAEVLPSPLLSTVIQDCLARGLDVTAGGAHYNFSGPQGVQVANVADSLAAVRQFVYDERRLSAADLLDALRQNWAGREPLRQALIHRAPKYGNDDDRVDAHAAAWAARFAELVGRHPTVRGGTYQPGFYTVSAHVPMGAQVGATPDGRWAGAPLADGGLSPTAGRDRRGPTAVLRSVGKLDLALASNGALLNMKFLPSFFDGPHSLDKFVALLRGFCALRIPHVQFNVVSAATLRAAQANPDAYRHLVVRVAGYSAYFTELDGELQEEIIRRTEFEAM